MLSYKPDTYLLPRFPLIKTTSTAVYAAVAAKISGLLAFVSRVRLSAKPVIYTPMSHNLVLAFVTKYRLTTAPISRIAAIVELMAATT